MSAAAEMPYFIKPSVNLDKSDKEKAYKLASQEISAVLHGETDRILKMATINCILKSNLPYFYWVGFYVVNNGRLSVGPYQGTLGCLHIDFGTGVCGKAAAEGKTQIVKNVHLLAQGKDHIACDPNSSSEIVLPVFDNNNELIAVFDVDSTVVDSFDETDQEFLENILKEQFSQ